VLKEKEFGIPSQLLLEFLCYFICCCCCCCCCFLYQVDIITGIFTHQLTEARHRGAFEMAYTGFSKLCSILWESADATRSVMPRGWIQELLESLQSSSVAKLLTVTRRSAGLPFFVQVCL